MPRPDTTSQRWSGRSAGQPRKSGRRASHADHAHASASHPAGQGPDSARRRDVGQRLAVLHGWEVRIWITPGRRHVEDVPDRPDRIDVPRVFTVVPGSKHQLARPPMPEGSAVAGKYVHDRHLLAVRTLRVIVAVVSVVPGGEQVQVPPAAIAREVADPLWA